MYILGGRCTCLYVVRTGQAAIWWHVSWLYVLGITAATTVVHHTHHAANSNRRIFKGPRLHRPWDVCDSRDIFHEEDWGCPRYPFWPPPSHEISHNSREQRRSARSKVCYTQEFRNKNERTPCKGSTKNASPCALGFFRYVPSPFDMYVSCASSQQHVVSIPQRFGTTNASQHRNIATHQLLYLKYWYYYYFCTTIIPLYCTTVLLS